MKQRIPHMGFFLFSSQKVDTTKKRNKIYILISLNRENFHGVE